jgi:hypothetical protein
VKRIVMIWLGLLAGLGAPLPPAADAQWVLPRPSQRPHQHQHLPANHRHLRPHWHRPAPRHPHHRPVPGRNHRAPPHHQPSWQGAPPRQFRS